MIIMIEKYNLCNILYKNHQIVFLLLLWIFYYDKV